MTCRVDRGPEGTAVQAERGRSAHQREPGPGRGAPSGHPQRPFPRRGQLWTHFDHGRGGTGTSCCSGMTPEQHERLAETPDGSMFPQYRLGLSGPLRIPDMVSHFRSLGLPDFQAPVPAKSFLATSLRNRSLAWGVIYLAKGEGGLGSPPRTPSVGRGNCPSKATLLPSGANGWQTGSIPSPRLRPAVRRPVVRIVISAFTGSFPVCASLPRTTWVQGLFPRRNQDKG